MSEVSSSITPTVSACRTVEAPPAMSKLAESQTAM